LFLDDFHRLDVPKQDRRRRMEAEANRFAAALLMPAAKLRAAMRTSAPDLHQIVRLAREFDVSKEAMARTYVEAQREPVAVLILHHGRIQRIYRGEDVPWITSQPNRNVPTTSLASGHRLQPGNSSEILECDPDVCFGDRDARRIEMATEQLLAQGNGFSMLLIHVELGDEEEADAPNWPRR